MTFYSCNAQPQSNAPTELPNAVTIKGRLMENYSVAHLSDAIQRLLFVMEKGNLYLPETGFYLNLEKEDAAEIGAEYILLVPLFEANNTDLFYGNYNKPMSFEAIPIPGVEHGYYTKNVSFFNEHNTVKANDNVSLYRDGIFKNPSTKDTIVWSAFGNYLDLRDISQWIEKLNSQESVTVHHIGCAETTDGGFTIHNYEKMELAEFAKQRLAYVSNRMVQLGAPQEEGSQTDWKKWIDKIMSYDLGFLEDRNRENHLTKSFKENSNAITAMDYGGERLVRMVRTPQYLNYVDQEIVIFDPATKGIRNYKFNNDNQRIIQNLRSFVLKGDFIFTINDALQWMKFSIPDSSATNSMCKLISKKTLLPEIKDEKSNPYEVDQVWMNDEIGYVLYHKKDTKNYFVICVNTQTGEKLSQASVNQLLKSPSTLKHLSFYYDEEGSNGFAVLMEVNGAAHHLVFNPDASLIQQINLGANFRWYPHFIGRDGIVTDANRQFYYDGEDDNVRFYLLNKKSVSVTLKDRLFDAELIVTDGKNLRLFYEYGDAFSHGIKSQLLDGQSFQPIGEPATVFSQVQVEGESSENTPTQLSAFKSGESWLISFMIDNEWHIINKQF